MLDFHRSIPVVDLLVGTALFHADPFAPRASGHADLDRLEAGGVDLVGLSLATRFPDLRATLSRPHFAMLGLPTDDDIAILEALVGRIQTLAAESSGRLALVREAADLDRVGDGVIRAFLGVQGAHALGGDLGRIERLRALGVRMLGLTHVMDNDVAGAGTGRRAGGLTPFGREVVEELERQRIVVDLAHASSATIREVVPRLTRPFVLSHTGLQLLASGRSRWRRYSPATRNLSTDDARLVAEARGVIGLTLSAQLLGTRTLAGLADAFARAADLVGPEQLALGSDFDGGLPTVVAADGLPAVTAALLDRGFSHDEVAGIMGGNALRLLRLSVEG